VVPPPSSSSQQPDRPVQQRFIDKAGKTSVNVVVDDGTLGARTMILAMKVPSGCYRGEQTQGVA
jgi:hypothetical protein